MRVISCPGVVVRVVDGDTVLVRVDLGWRVELETAVRVDGINAPEVSTAAGKAARDYAAGLLPPGTPIVLSSTGLLGSFEKYGRVLGSISFPPPSDPRAVLGDFATAMLAAHQAAPWDGHGPRPVP